MEVAPFFLKVLFIAFFINSSILTSFNLVETLETPSTIIFSPSLAIGEIVACTIVFSSFKSIPSELTITLSNLAVLNLVYSLFIISEFIFDGSMLNFKAFSICSFGVKLIIFSSQEFTSTYLVLAPNINSSSSLSTSSAHSIAFKSKISIDSSSNFSVYEYPIFPLYIPLKETPIDVLRPYLSTSPLDEVIFNNSLLP